MPARSPTSDASCNWPWLKKHVSFGSHSSMLSIKHTHMLLLFLNVSSTLQATLHEITLTSIGQVTLVCVTFSKIPFPPHFSSCTNTLFVQLMTIILTGAKLSLNEYWNTNYFSHQFLSEGLTACKEKLIISFGRSGGLMMECSVYGINWWENNQVQPTRRI